MNQRQKKKQRKRELMKAHGVKAVVLPKKGSDKPVLLYKRNRNHTPLEVASK